MDRFLPRHRGLERITRCVFGLALFGAGVALLIASDLGAAPWDVFHTGVSELTGLGVGEIIVITGVALLLLWIPLREQPGLGTILNALEVGVVAGLVLAAMPDVEALAPRTAMMLGGVLLIGIGSGFYIGANLGPGPRDGLMTGIARRGASIRTARTGIEVTVLVIGVLLGGSVGVGTAVFALAIGPLVQLFLPLLTVPAGPASAPAHRAV